MPSKRPAQIPYSASGPTHRTPQRPPQLHRPHPRPHERPPLGIRRKDSKFLTPKSPYRRIYPRSYGEKIDTVPLYHRVPFRSWLIPGYRVVVLRHLEQSIEHCELHSELRSSRCAPDGAGGVVLRFDRSAVEAFLRAENIRLGQGDATRF